MPEWIEIPVVVGVVLTVLSWLLTPADAEFNRKPGKGVRGGH